ncbi:MAG: SRPBCC family protein [Caulobacter sp.]|nr:SRPBCC family protein [Caulobacter sp.]
MWAVLFIAVAATGVFAEVSHDPGGTAGIVRGRVDIEAPPAVVWNVILDCNRARRMAPNVQSCKVLDRAADGSWDVREMVVAPPLVPKVRSVFKSSYEPVRRITFKCTGGDVKVCEGEWRLTVLPSGGTRVSYTNRAASPYPAIPASLTREAMRGDMVRALKALRRECLAAAR